MKTVILAGGFGTRLSELTDIVPKPMVDINNFPMIWHIMNLYMRYGYNDFLLALGYKANIFKEYFLNFKTINSDFKINLLSGEIETISSPMKNINISMIDTGINTMTGGRIKALEENLKSERFFATYGDGLSNINLKKLLDFHIAHGKLATVTAVRPIARFGELVIDDDSNEVKVFQEKVQLKEGWINGGFFIFEPGFLDYIDSEETILEKEPLERAAADGELVAYKHDGFWMCMDTKRDRDYLDNLAKGERPPWKN
jgi:glucose-1-phosphate cytidylyltransferase